MHQLHRRQPAQRQPARRQPLQRQPAHRHRRAAVAAVLAALLGVPVSGAVPAAAATCPSPGGVAVTEAPMPTDEVVFRGHGRGHQLGMSQYGAQGAAELGCTYDRILAAYYPGTTLARQAMAATVMIDMLTDGGSATLLAEGGPVTWTVPGTSTRLTQAQGATWKVLRDGNGVRVWDGEDFVIRVGAGTEVRAGHRGTAVRVRTFRAGGAAHLDRRLRWDHARFTGDAAGLDVRQVMSDRTAGDGEGVTTYLKGIAEVPVSWEPEALKTQVVAARTFLTTKWDAAAGAYVVLPTPAHQNYTGADQEDVDRRYGGDWAAAVEATRRGGEGSVVLDAGGRPIEALYSSSFGGRGEDVRYVYRSTGYPYLRAIDDSRWDAAGGSRDRSWERGFSLATTARVFGFDTVESMTLASWGTTERFDGIRVTGLRGGVRTSQTFRGWDVKSWFGLPSTGFAVHVQSIGGDAAVPLPGDWDGDGDSDPGWWRDGAVALRVGAAVTRFRYGRPGDVPLVGDWDDDGRDEIGVVRDGVWYLRNTLTSGAADRSFIYGRIALGDLPLVGDWDGDGRDGVGIVRGGEWHLRNSLSGGHGERVFTYGRILRGDVPIVGDWDADGDDTPGIVRDRDFHLRNVLAGGTADHTIGLGRATDRPVAGDWDRDGRTTPGVVRETRWFLDDDLDGGPASRSVQFPG